MSVDLEAIGHVLERAWTGARSALGAGPAHRRRLREIDVRIAVAGTRGKSTTTRWLHDVFYHRGYDTFAKVTGDQPQIIYNSITETISRESLVRLYENERELARFEDADIDVAIFENQGIRQYTTRLVNEQFVRPDVVFITNVREDHLDTLGRDRGQIARALARSVPSDTPVICGEGNPDLREYIAAELDRRDAPVTFVDPPPAEAATPGAECVYGLNAVLEAVGELPVAEEKLTAYLDELRPEWVELPGGRVYNAASVNDVQSTELVRGALVGSSDTVVEPLVCLRADRRGRTASFLRYLDRLYDAGAIERVHVVGAGQRLFELHASFPVVCHDTASESPGEVLDATLAEGRPVLLMGNTVDAFMKKLEQIIESRSPDIGSVEGKSVVGRNEGGRSDVNAASQQ